MSSLIEVRTQQKERADQVFATARRNLHVTQQQVEAAKLAASVAATNASQLQDDYKKLQRELCEDTLKADRDRLSNEMEDNLRRQKAANDAVVETADAQTDTERLAADLAAAVDAAKAAATAAATAYDEAGKQEEQLAGWRAALQSAATAEAISNAKTGKAGDPYKSARDRLSRVLGGDEMLDVYRQRAWFAAHNAARATNLLDEALRGAANARQTSEPLTSTRMLAAVELGLTIDVVQDAAEATVTLLATARKALTEIAARGDEGEDEDPLKTQLARLHMLAARARAVGAPAKEKAVSDAWRVVHQKEKDLAAAQLESLASDPEVPPEEAAEVDDEEQAVTTARDDAQDAEDALETKVDWTPPTPPGAPAVKVSPKDALDDYELAMPAPVLADVVTFFDAEMAIDKVAGVDVAGLLGQLDSREAAYAAAEEKDVSARRGVALVDAQVESRRRRQIASAGTAAAHKLLTIRGDR